MAEPQVAPTLQSFQPRSGLKRLRKVNVILITPVHREDIQIPLDVYDDRTIACTQIRFHDPLGIKGLNGGDSSNRPIHFEP
jgi:hypothetical protein